VFASSHVCHLWFFVTTSGKMGKSWQDKKGNDRYTRKICGGRAAALEGKTTGIPAPLSHEKNKARLVIMICGLIPEKTPVCSRETLIALMLIIARQRASSFHYTNRASG
jgi:hypothetical protein